MIKINIYKSKDTIVAIATPIGKGGVGIVRVSGILVNDIAYKILGKIPCPRKAEYLTFYDKNKNIIDSGIVIFFPQPKSFTGEDIIEFHAHGSLIILNLLIENILLIKNVRIARPGEFSERAFLNNKIDLIQAEAISDLINANSIKVANLVRKSLYGFFSNYINKLIKKINNLRMFIEADINFPNEEINYLSYNQINNKLNNIIFELNKIIIKTKKGNLLKNGVNVIIIGKPNAGKSSLFNALIEKDKAIVTNISGTTRDILNEQIYLNETLINIIDTAGICNINNEIEKISMEKIFKEIKKANHILLVVDVTSCYQKTIEEILLILDKNLKLDIPITILYNKIDLIKIGQQFEKHQKYPFIEISTQSKSHINYVKKYLKDKITNLTYDSENIFFANHRHTNLLNITMNCLKQGKKQLNNNRCFNYEFLAEELRFAYNALNEIIGNFITEDILKEIFSNFCIGK